MTSGLAADEGFEPSQTESESDVLPLHKSAVFHRTLAIIARFEKKSRPNLQFFSKRGNLNINALKLLGDEPSVGRIRPARGFRRAQWEKIRMRPAERTARPCANGCQKRHSGH